MLDSNHAIISSCRFSCWCSLRFDYTLPTDRIAQKPAEDRSASRMLLLDRNSGRIEDAYFKELPSRLKGNELMVVNNARVIPARLFAHRAGILAEPPGKHGARGHLSSRIEVLLTRRIDSDVWEALVRPGRKVGTGEKLFFEGAALEAEVIWRGELRSSAAPIPRRERGRGI